MFRPRIIPVLLLRDLGLVKSKRFRDHRYIGDPINAVKIFNDKKADELVFLDITASKGQRVISLDFVRKVGDEANMPFAVGGGIRTISDIKEILNEGAEKVVLNTVAHEDDRLVRDAVENFGSSTIAVCIDVKKKFMGKEQVWIYGGQKATGEDPATCARRMEGLGVGEIIIQSIERDGTMEGFDLPMIQRIASAVSIPVVALGGAGSLSDLKRAVLEGKASAAAAGSLFVFHGARRAVLISYPSDQDLSDLFR